MSGAPEPRLRMPGEWTTHERTLMAWPCRAEMWGSLYPQTKIESAAVANAIAAFEPVTMFCANEALATEARAVLTAASGIRVLPMDGSWMRDTGPVYVSNGARREARHFRFNAHGEKHARRDRDAALGASVARVLGDPVVPVDLVLEGGALASNGTGRLVVTRHCLMDSNRNWQIDEATVEARLRDALGMDEIIWLPAGPKFDQQSTGSDGHTDIFLDFIAPDRAMLLAASSPEDEDAALFAEWRAIFAERGISVIDVPWLPVIEHERRRVPASYLNFYLCNGAVIVPVAEVDPDMDQQALRLIAACLPDRQVVPIAIRAHPAQGGAIHCITQQVPRVGTAS